MRRGEKTVARARQRRHCINGFTYLWVLISIAILGIGLVTVSGIWSATARRQKLVQLDWVGQQFVQAIGSYYKATPGIVVKTYPPSLEALLEDRRYVFAFRHLRQIYVNPFTGNADWTLVLAAQGGICGVRVAVPSEFGASVRDYCFDPAGSSKPAGE
jgi:type II secretory pathway pseudopilin PulG